MKPYKLKTAVFVHTFPCYSETFIVNQIIDLIDRGHEVDIYTRHYNENAIIHEQVAKYKLINKLHSENIPGKLKRMYLLLRYIFVYPRQLIPTLNFMKYGRQALNLLWFSTVLSYLPQKKSYDIVHAHFGINGNHVLTLRQFGLFKKARLITSFHGEDGDYPFIDQQIYQNLFATSMITVNSEFLRNIILSYGYSNNNIHKLPEGLNTKLFQRKKNKSINSTTNIICVGRLVEWKGSPYIVKVASALKKRLGNCFHFFIVGDGEMRPYLENYIEEESLQDVVTLQGIMTQQQIISLMEECDIFFHPAITGIHGNQEYQGLVIQEAQAMELPVVVADVGGIKEGMLNEETGFLIKEKDTDTMSNKIELLITNPELRIAMGKKGREYITNNFDSHILGNKLEKIYYTMVNR